METTDNDTHHFQPEYILFKEDMNRADKQGRYPHLYEALDHEREMYQDLANAHPLGIYRLRVFHDGGISEDRWNSIDNAPYKIEFVNNRLVDILNIDKAAFIRNPGIINNYIFIEDKPEFIRRNVESNKNIIPFVWEGRFVVNGRLRWIHFESIPRVLENKDIMWTGFFEDISEQKRASEELKQKNSELQLLNAEKDKFFSIISHDLKSPFNSILGFTGILLEKVNQTDIAGIRDYCEIIRNSSQKAMNLLQNLIIWSQAQTGRMEFKPEYFNLRALTDEIVQLYEEIALQKSIRIINEGPDDLTVFADKDMLSTVIRNLISNAIKFTPSQGSVWVATETLPKGIVITVRDNGVGMTQETIQKLFHIDSSHSTPDTSGEKGTGLGLLLCKEFINKHNGIITIKSEQGKGSEFRVEIPVISEK